MTKCKHCGTAIEKRGKEWRHVPTGFWKCLTTNAEPDTVNQSAPKRKTVAK